MLAVREEYRGKGIATKLVRMAIDAMIARDAEEVCRILSVLKSYSIPVNFLRQPNPNITLAHK